MTLQRVICKKRKQVVVAPLRMLIHDEWGSAGHRRRHRRWGAVIVVVVFGAEGVVVGVVSGGLWTT